LKGMATTRLRLFSYINAVLYALIAAALVWCITLWGQPLRRDAARLHDVSVMAPFIGQNQLIGLVARQSGNSIHGFFMRYYFISLDEINLNRPYIVVEKTMPLPASISNNVELIPIQTQAFDLYRLKR
jgi:hypothetical protein